MSVTHIAIILLVAFLAVLLLGALWGALRTAARPAPQDDNAGWGDDDWFMKF